MLQLQNVAWKAPGSRQNYAICSTQIRPLRIITTCAVKARWCLDIKYGAKMDAVALLQEWTRDVGSVAGLTPSNTAINSGSVGTPESRLELEVTFDTLAELEQFWASIPPDRHKAWSQRIQTMIVHGSPMWEIFRTVEAFPGAENAAAPAVSSSAPSLVLATSDEIGKFGEAIEPSLPSPSAETASGIAVVNNAEDAEAVLDWKGEPMKLNPGDRLPFKFF